MKTLLIFILFIAVMNCNAQETSETILTTSAYPCIDYMDITIDEIRESLNMLTENDFTPPHFSEAEIPDSIIVHFGNNVNDDEVVKVSRKDDIVFIFNPSDRYYDQEQEIDNLKRTVKKKNVIFVILIGILFLVLGISWYYYREQSGELKHRRAGDWRKKSNLEEVNCYDSKARKRNLKTK